MALGPQRVQQALIIDFQLQAALGCQVVPAVAGGEVVLLARFLEHLQKQYIGELRHVFVIGNAVVAQDVA